MDPSVRCTTRFLSLVYGGTSTYTVRLVFSRTTVPLWVSPSLSSVRLGREVRYKDLFHIHSNLLFVFLVLHYRVLRGQGKSGEGKCVHVRWKMDGFCPFPFSLTGTRSRLYRLLREVKPGVLKGYPGYTDVGTGSRKKVVGVLSWCSNIYHD